MRFLALFLFVVPGLICFGQAQVTVTIGYPDNENYFIYSIPPADENARFGGEYYVKIKNTGSVDLTNWKMTTNWKSLNSTWGVVTKTVIYSATGLIELTGPSWDLDLSIGDSVVISGEWVTSMSVEDWIDFLPHNISFWSSNSPTVPVIFDTNGTINTTSWSAQKVKPIDPSRKTFASKKIVAYFPVFDAERAWCSLQRYGDNIDELRVQLYSISPSGVLQAGQNTPAGVNPLVDIDYWYDFIDSIGVVDYCTQHGIELIPVIYNYNDAIGDFDQQAVHAMMVNPTLRAQHLTAINNLLLAHTNFAGVDVDYESLMATDRDNYSLFIEDLAGLVHNAGKIITTALHTKVGPGTWYGPLAQDYERIGNAVDEILLMTYDLHWGTSPTFSNPPPTAGCQATPDWMNDIAFFAISEVINPAKIHLGLPFYGYRWKQGFENHTLQDPGVGLTIADANQLITTHNVQPASITREPNGKELNFTVNISGTNWVCYFQDSVSIAYKLSSFNENDLKDYIGGIGIWRLGGETDAVWNSLVFAMKGTNAIIGQTACSNPVNLGIESNLMNSKIDIYPNPTTSIMHINNHSSDELQVEIVDMNGKLVNDLKTILPNHSTTVDTGLQQGVYFVRISIDNDLLEVHKIIIQ